MMVLEVISLITELRTLSSRVLKSFPKTRLEVCYCGDEVHPLIPLSPHTPRRGSQPEATPCTTELLPSLLRSPPPSFSPHGGSAPLCAAPGRGRCWRGGRARCSLTGLLGGGSADSSLPPARDGEGGGRGPAAGRAGPGAGRAAGPGVAPPRPAGGPGRSVPRPAVPPPPARPPPRSPPSPRSLCKMAAAAERGAEVPAEPPRGARPPPLGPEEVARRLASTRRELSNRRKILLRNLPAESSSQVRPPPPLSRPAAWRGCRRLLRRAVPGGGGPRGSRSAGPA